ncbi:MAG: dihydroorotase, partial [Bacteroidota bacterium]
MVEKFLLKDITLVNDGRVFMTDVLIANGMIEKIGSGLDEPGARLINGTGKLLLPGIIDGQVHFREPGLTHKGDLYTESKAAVAGGVTSFIDMPNTVPNVLTPEILQEKYRLASEKSLANFGFFMGVNGDNIAEVSKMDTSKLLGVSDDGLYFTKMGNVLADNRVTLELLCSSC